MFSLFFPVIYLTPTLSRLRSLTAVCSLPCVYLTHRHKLQWLAAEHHVIRAVKARKSVLLKIETLSKNLIIPGNL